MSKKLVRCWVLRVLINGPCFSWRQITSTTEDPIVGLFNIFIRDMEQVMECTLVTFADDIKLGEYTWGQGCHSEGPRQKPCEAEQGQIQILYLETKSPVQWYKLGPYWLGSRCAEEDFIDSHLHIMCLNSKGGQQHPGLCYQEHASRSKEATVPFYSACQTVSRYCVQCCPHLTPNTRKTLTHKRKHSRGPLR